MGVPTGAAVKGGRSVIAPTGAEGKLEREVEDGGSVIAVDRAGVL